MAFVRYQKVRNRVLGVFAAVGATVGGIFGYQSMTDSGGSTDPVAARSASSGWQEESLPPARSSHARSQKLVAPVPAQTPARPESTFQPTPVSQPTLAVQPTPSRRSTPANRSTPQRQLTNTDRYIAAMKSANANSRRSAKAKDVLGSRSPWKLNLYDDNKDGQWDRAKLDIDRDEVDDEKWTYKNGYWEKEDSRLVWSKNKWVARSSLTGSATNVAEQRLARYRAAFKIATARANASGKGKDVLGSRSPWKLNLYDENRDGQWDRAKLDTNRDEVDDEKWTFKKGRWEKDNGKLVWANDNWESAASIAKSQSAGSASQRYQAAFKIANARADASGKGKDVLGSKSPWKLNLYDENRDGQWDRAKLDTNRDDVDDEKWTFKNSRWEKENGTKIWAGGRWESVKAIASAVKKSAQPESNRYRLAMQLANGRANSSGKGKDVLGSESPWKLNLYDDDRDGQWERAKLDKNRDGIDDEKWNFKKGRWEKESGAAVWDGEKWLKSSRQ